MSRVAAALIADMGPDDLAELAALLEPYMARSPAGDDGWLNAKDAARYLAISVDALHRLTASRTIPFSQDTPGGKVYLKPSDLDRWRAATAS